MGFTGPGLAVDNPPTWSPDSAEFVWAGGDTFPDDWNLVVANRDGSELRQLAARGSQPAWSPDGSHLAWVAQAPFGDLMFFFDADLLSPRQISPASRLRNQSPSWSPDGTTVVWSGSTGNADPIEILSYDTTTDEFSVLASSGNTVSGWGKRPAWSADGRSLSWRDHGTNHDQVAIWSGATGSITTPFDADEGPDEILWRPSPFRDVRGDSFAFADGSCLAWLGLTTGTSGSTYSPDLPVTREQMAAFLARLWRELGFDCPAGGDPFTDVAPNSFARADVSCIFQLGITTGTSSTTYSPNLPATREQMAAFLVRLWRAAVA